jgi:hypothetical protein
VAQAWQCCSCWQGHCTGSGRETRSAPHMASYVCAQYLQDPPFSRVLVKWGSCMISQAPALVKKTPPHELYIDV